jgi:hypothetical protein
MNKTLNIFAILLIIAFVNTNKMVSYSDIVSSLVQLSNDDNGLSNLKTIVENFESSNSLLSNLQTKVNENCRILRESGQTSVRSLNEKLSAYQKNIEKLTEENKVIDSDLFNDEQAVKREVEKTVVAKKDIAEARQHAINKEKEILESINVLKRLKNIAIDELQGIQQKSTDMYKFNVTVTTSFVQMPSFQEDLKGLLSKADSVNRGLISTLILLTQSAGKQTFANPETVKKIVAMIEKIIANSHSKIQESITNKDNQVKSYSEILENSRSLIARLKEEIQRRVNNKAGNEREIVFYRNDIIFFEKALARRVKRNEFHVGLCEKQSRVVQTHSDKYQESLNKVNELKGQLSAQ